MKIDQQLNSVADKYRTLGFNVVLRPGPADLPPFAKDFQVEMVATKEDGSALVAAKNSPLEFEADPNVARYAEITERQSGWRFDVFVLGPDYPVTKEIQESSELSDEDLRRGLVEAERMLQAGFVAPSLLAAWAMLESVMRRLLQAEGEESGWGNSPRTLLNELYSDGVLSTAVLRELEGIVRLRNALVHGFSAPAIEPAKVQFLIETARRLLTESQAVKQPA
jgi:uncharacterized protein YutE (UPF0331/DUF86 family)